MRHMSEAEGHVKAVRKAIQFPDNSTRMVEPWSPTRRQAAKRVLSLRLSVHPVLRATYVSLHVDCFKLGETSFFTRSILI